MNGPIERLSKALKQRWMTSGVFVVGSFLATIPLLWLARLPSPQPGMPGMAMEFPGTANTALAILRAFESAMLIGDLRTAIFWDFLLIILYTTAFISLLEWLARGEHGSDDELLPYAIKAAALAGALDMLEDIGMLVLIPQASNPQETALGATALLTTLAALLKWTLVLAVAGYSLWELGKKSRAVRNSGPHPPTNLEVDPHERQQAEGTSS